MSIPTLCCCVNGTGWIFAQQKQHGRTPWVRNGDAPVTMENTTNDPAFAPGIVAWILWDDSPDRFLMQTTTIHQTVFAVGGNPQYEATDVVTSLLWREHGGQRSFYEVFDSTGGGGEHSESNIYTTLDGVVTTLVDDNWPPTQERLPWLGVTPPDSYYLISKITVEGTETSLTLHYFTIYDAVEVEFLTRTTTLAVRNTRANIQTLASLLLARVNFGSTDAVEIDGVPTTLTAWFTDHPNSSLYVRDSTTKPMSAIPGVLVPLLTTTAGWAMSWEAPPDIRSCGGGCPTYGEFTFTSGANVRMKMLKWHSVGAVGDQFQVCTWMKSRLSVAAPDCPASDPDGSHGLMVSPYISDDPVVGTTWNGSYNARTVTYAFSGVSFVNCDSPSDFGLSAVKGVGSGAISEWVPVDTGYVEQYVTGLWTIATQQFGYGPVTPPCRNIPTRADFAPVMLLLLGDLQTGGYPPFNAPVPP